MVKRIGDLELDEDLAHQRNEWRFESIGMAILIVVVIAALLGVFGTGPISSARTDASATGVTVSYERILRHQGRGSLEIAIPANAVSDGTVTVLVSDTFMDVIELEGMHPEAAEMRSADGGTVLVFDTDTTVGDVSVVLDFVPDTIGMVDGTIRVNAGDPITFSQVVLP